MDILLPGIRAVCDDVATDIATAKMVAEDAYMIAFRPKIRAFVKIDGITLHHEEPHKVAEVIRVRMEQVKSACEHAINEVFDKPQKDTIIEFSLGEQSPQPTI